jgi:acyl-coenzyme A synthetase/AMP-(fatty) acid ligase
MSSSLSPEPILTAWDAYRGSITDLDRGVSADSDTLRAVSDSFGRFAADNGLEAGQRVVMCISNGPLFCAALTGLLARGGCPLLLHAATPSAEVERYALRLGARYAFVESCPADGVSTSTVRVYSHAAGDWAGAHWWDFGEGDSSSQRSDAALAGVVLHPTSGTTGDPKVAVRHGAAALAEATHYVETLGLDPSDAVLCAVPMSHAYGYGMCVMAPLLCGAAIYSTREFNPRVVQSACDRFAITTLPTVPAMLDLLLLGMRRRRSRTPRRVLSAGAPLMDSTAQRFFEQTGTAVRPLYGTTETGGISVGEDVGVPTAGACVGQPMNGVEVEVRHEDSDEQLPDHVGLVRVRSTSMMAGYLEQGRVGDSLLPNGWFETGDLGYRDEGGALHLVGREKDVINVFGLKVLPSEVEEVIACVEGVRDVKVYAGLHHSGSQIVKAAVEAPASLDVAVVRRHCEEHLAPYKRPEVVTRMNALPRSAMGKVLRSELP